jgi:hypothetical protein
MCKCGLAADPEIDERKRFVCTGCRRDGIKLICNVAHSDTDPANCFLCDKCLLHISFTGNLRCCCGGCKKGDVFLFPGSAKINRCEPLFGSRTVNSAQTCFETISGTRFIF